MPSLVRFIENCEAANLNGGDFFRQNCCGQKPIRKSKSRRPDQKITAQLLGKIMQSQLRMARLDNNVNQIAKVLNIAAKTKTEREIAGIFSRNEAMLSELIVLYKEYANTTRECRDMLRQSLMW